MGIRFPMWQGCGVGVLRIATPVCELVRNDIFGECGGTGRRGRRPLRTHGKRVRSMAAAGFWGFFVGE